VVALGGATLIGVAIVAIRLRNPWVRKLVNEEPELYGFAMHGVLGVMFRGQLHLVVEVVIGNRGYPTEVGSLSMALVKNDFETVVEDLQILGATSVPFQFDFGAATDRETATVQHSNLLVQVSLGKKINTFGAISGYMVGKVEHFTAAGMSNLLLAIGYMDQKRQPGSLFASCDGIVVRDARLLPGDSTIQDTYKR
jgi:hypothetical protein